MKKVIAIIVLLLVAVGAFADETWDAMSKAEKFTFCTGVAIGLVIAWQAAIDDDDVLSVREFEKLATKYKPDFLMIIIDAYVKENPNMPLQDVVAGAYGYSLDY